MIFSWLWIITRLAFIVFFLLADFAFNYGASGHHLQSKGNSSSAGTRGVEANFLNGYFADVLNKSRALEEVIYSDILNNLRNLLKSEKNQSVEAANKNNDAIGKSEKGEHDKRNKGNPRIPGHRNKSNGILSGPGPAERGTGNVTLTGRPVQGVEYFLGYSGNPFGSRKPISGLVEVPEIDPLGREVADPRRKRSVLHLYNMVLCTTGCNPFAYKGYGCYCGFLGSGFVVDGIDSCCKMHDWCYNSAGCPMFLEYFIPYLWQCHHHQPVCAIDHGYYGGPGSCAQRLCECDRQLALCLRRYPCPSSKALCTSSPWRLLQNVLML